VPIVLGDRRTIKEIAQDYQAATGIEPTLKRLGGLGDLKQILDEEGKDNVLL
jgi:hypothetical protein